MADDDIVPIYCCPADHCHVWFDVCGYQMHEHLKNVHEITGPEMYAQARAENVRGNLDDLRNRFPRMEEWTLDTYPTDERAMAAIQALENTDTLNTYLWGGVGVGKTGLAWGLLIDHLKMRCPGDFVNLVQLFRTGKQAMSRGEKFDPYARLLEGGNGDGHLLVVDDIGAERPSPWALDVVATVVQERYLNNACTVFTSNFSPSQLIRRLGHADLTIGKRIVSRIVEDCTVLHIDSADRRVNAIKDAA